jgi:hypothetical protein
VKPRDDMNDKNLGVWSMKKKSFGCRVETKIFVFVFSRKFRENENFLKTKFRENVVIFAFRENEKNVFVSTLFGRRGTVAFKMALRGQHKK